VKWYQREKEKMRVRAISRSRTPSDRRKIAARPAARSGPAAAWATPTASCATVIVAPPGSLTAIEGTSF
jgi:hypothetical protein